MGGLPEFGEAREDSEGEENKGAGNRKDLESSIDPGNTQIGLLTEAAEDESKKAARRRDIPGSTAFVPSAAGLIIAGEVIADLTGIR